VVCLIAYHGCAQDAWDLDRDGDAWESIGACRDVVCGEPEEERCGDLLDNDRDGHTDEGCGECECTFGAIRWCDDPAYSRVGTQACDDSGRWDRCDEATLLPGCADLDGWYSPEYEDCLIAQGECAQDLWDVDSDGDTWESLGDCPDALCFD
jgi:hypothetical protein